METLPPECILNILRFLSLSDWCRCRASSKIFDVLSHNELQVRKSHIGKIYDFMNNVSTGLCYFSSLGHEELVNYFINKGATNLIAAMEKSIYNGHDHIALMLYDKIYKIQNDRDSEEYIRCLNSGLCASACVKSPSLICFFINKGAKPYYGLFGSCAGFNLELASFFVTEYNFDKKILDHALKILCSSFIANKRIDNDLTMLLINSGASCKNVLYVSLSSDDLLTFNYFFELMTDVGETIDIEMLVFLIFKNKIKSPSIISYLITKGYNNYNLGIKMASMANDMDCINIFIDKGADMYMGLEGASIGGHKQLVDFFVDRIFDPRYHIMNNQFGEIGNLILNFFNENQEFIKIHKQISAEVLKKAGHVHIWNVGLIGASIGGHRDLIDFFIDKGAENFNSALIGSIAGKNLDIVKFLISKGANNLGEALQEAINENNDEIINYLSQLIESPPV